MFTQDRLARHSHVRTTGRLARWRWLFLLLPLLRVAEPHAGDAGDFSVDGMHARANGGVHLLDAHFAIRLSPGAREALDSGVPITFELQIQLVRNHLWLWDAVEAEHVRSRQLEFHALSRSYLVKDVDGGTQGNYTRLEDALAAAGSIEKLLITSMPLDPDRDYYIRLRGALDIEALPTPVRLLAYVSTDWDMSSEWSVWPLGK